MKISILTICFLLLCTGINPIFSWWGRRRRRRRRPPVCNPVNCQVGSWSVWSSCSHHCGTSGTQTRSRQITSSAQCGGQCKYNLTEEQSCNRGNCQNGGTPNSGGCSCRLGYEGICCVRGESPSWKKWRIQAAKWTNVSVWASWKSQFRPFKLKICETLKCSVTQRIIDPLSRTTASKTRVYLSY